MNSKDDEIEREAHELLDHLAELCGWESVLEALDGVAAPILDARDALDEIAGVAAGFEITQARMPQWMGDA